MKVAGHALALAVLVAGSSLAAEPQLQSMCAQMADFSPKSIRELKDPDLEKFVCVAAKATLRAGTTNDHAAEANCRIGLKKLIDEFSRRWPQRAASDVTGKC
jgi:hypothetical protein